MLFVKHMHIWQTVTPCLKLSVIWITNDGFTAKTTEETAASREHKSRSRD